ncbi:MAG TPA: elongation factor G [Candidatus Acidoferrales bacterium]|nr:elongation factor G [Candidatus Acidoferrales bacterium]
MPTLGPDRIRNVVLLGHSHEGKTSLCEAMLVTAGTIVRAGSTSSGTSTLDFEPEEHRHQISINLALADLEFGQTKVNLIDTPGFVDFAGQVASGVAVADSALIVVSPSATLAVGTEAAWARVQSNRMPRLIVINKMDRDNADFYGALDSMRAQMSPKPVALNLPIGSEATFRGVVDLLHMRATVLGDGKAVEGPIPDDMQELAATRREQLVEAAAEGDDQILARYLEDGTLSDEDVERGLSEGVRDGTVCPVVCCSATAMIGVRTLIRTICELLPAPPCDAQAAASAFVFNTTADPFVGRISYIKVLGGRLLSEQHLPNRTRGGEERLGQIFTLRGKNHLNCDELVAGDIGAVAKLAHTLTGDVLGSEPTRMPDLRFPNPSYSLAIFPRTRGDEDRISIGLARLAEEDPSLGVNRDEVTHQLVISGLGDVHLAVILEKLKRKYSVEAETQVPKVGYLETISRTARAEGRHVKQSGGHGQYGVCTIEIAPLSRGEGLIWEDKVFGGSIPQSFRPSVHKGVVDAMTQGVISGHPMVDVRVTLLDGKYHPVDSSDMAFQLAGSIAFRKAVAEAEPVLLEPVMDVVLNIPERSLGEVMSDLNTKRARILGSEGAAGWQSVRVQMPESEIHELALGLRSLTQGRGDFSTAFSHYELVPTNLTRMVIEARQGETSGRD